MRLAETTLKRRKQWRLSAVRRSRPARLRVYVKSSRGSFSTRKRGKVLPPHQHCIMTGIVRQKTWSLRNR
jgi:hypothetical protein